MLWLTQTQCVWKRSREWRLSDQRFSPQFHVFRHQMETVVIFQKWAWLMFFIFFAVNKSCEKTQTNNYMSPQVWSVEPKPPCRPSSLSSLLLVPRAVIGMDTAAVVFYESIPHVRRCSCEYSLKYQMSVSRAAHLLQHASLAPVLITLIKKKNKPLFWNFSKSFRKQK